MRKEVSSMETTMKTANGKQFIFTCPARFESRNQSANQYANQKRDIVVNGVRYKASDPSKRLNPAPSVDRSPLKFQKIAGRKEKSFRKLMNCKSVDKFDEGTHANYQKAKFNGLRQMTIREVRAYCLAGAVITYDHWNFQRKVVFKNQVLGSCTKSVIDALVSAGVVHESITENGGRCYQK
ncbi:MAG: hypothetical protein PUF41_11690 [Prevotella copri]|nr:hypothetical protein [Segatella copri]